MPNTQPVAKQSHEDIELEVKVRFLLHELRVPTNFQGHAFVREAVLILYKNSGFQGSFTKDLYPAIAERFNTNWQCVERNIRHAIQHTWSNGNRDELRRIFPSHSTTRLPTVSLFITGLTEELEIRALQDKQAKSKAKSQLRGGHRISME